MRGRFMLPVVLSVGLLCYSFQPTQASVGAASAAGAGVAGSHATAAGATAARLHHVRPRKIARPHVPHVKSMSPKVAAAHRRAARRAKRGLWHPTAHAAGTGPTGLASVTVSSTLNCDVQTTVDSNPSFYGGDACGTFFEVDGTVYGPDSVPAGLSVGGFTPVSQTTTGSGTSADPYVITTVVDVGSTGIVATETDTWVVGAGSYTTSVQLQNTDTASHSIHVYRAGDCYFADNDYSFGEAGGLAGLPTGAVACQDAVDPSAPTPVPGNRMMEWVPQTPGNTYVEDYYATMWNDVGAGGDLPNTCQCTTYLDSSMALAWSGNLAPNAISTYNSSLVFNDNAPGNAPSPGEQGAGPNESENGTTCYSDDPVNCATGTFYRQFTDFSIPGRGVSLSLQRSYSSDTAAADGPFGFGWTDSYNMSLSTDSSGNVAVSQEDGSTITFAPDGSGGYTAPPRVLATLTQNPDGSYTLTREQTQVEYNFSSAGQLTSEVDQNGYVTKLAYSGGNLTSVTDPAGRTLTFTYSGSHIATVTDPLGRSYSYAYDSSGNLTGVTDPLGRTWSFTYDANHLLLTTTDPRGGAVTNTYDSQGRVVSQKDADGNTTTWAYAGDPTTSVGGTTTMTDPLGNQTVYTYENLELMSVTRGSGTSSAATTSYTYDPATLGVATVSDPNGNVTTNTYDSNGNLLSTTDPLGNTTSYTYNNFNEVTSKTTPLSEVTNYSYDGNGNLLSVTDPLGNTTNYAYGDSAHPGDVTSRTDPDGNVTSYTYDANGDLASMSVSPSSGMTDNTAYAYDADGERTCQASPDATAAGVKCPAAGSPPVSDTTATSYDAAGEVLSVTNPDGHTTSYAYDGGGNVAKVTDPNGNATQYTYNGNNQQTKITLPSGTMQATGYDADGNVITKTDPAGNVTKYAYDALNQVTSTTNPLGQTTAYTYDPAGNRTSITNPAGATTSFSYDQANELTGISYSDGTTPNVSYSYDADGHRASMTDGTGTTNYSYDADGHLTSVTDGAGNTVAYSYDPAGQPTTLTYPNGNSVTRSYDGAGRLSSVSDWLGHTTTFSYDASGNLVKEAYPNGVTAVTAYDNASQVTSTTDSTTSATLAKFTYTRDNAGQVTSAATTGISGGTQTYTYNSLSQLASRNGLSFSYDTAGNLTGLPSGTTQAFNAGDELTSTTVPASSAAPALDTSVSANLASAGSKITSPPVSTSANGELLLAFVSAAGPTGGSQTITGVSGAGLVWAKVARANKQAGTAEIWAAYAVSPVTSAKVTAALGTTGQRGSITVTAFKGAASVTGASAIANGVTTKPKVSLTTTQSHSLVWAVGEDATHASTLTPAAGQTVVHTDADSKSHATYWVQDATKQVTAAKITVTIADTLPAADHWNFAAVEIRSATATAATTSYNYDPVGNLTKITPSNGPATTLGYDQADRLVSYGGIATYAYNGDGLRMTKTVSGKITTFAWDTSDTLPALLASGNVDFVYGPSGQPIEHIQGSTVTYLHTDQQGSVRLITNSTGQVAGTYNYSSYGQTISHTGTAISTLQYDGQITDPESGLTYLRARYYNPATGQFLTMDPAASMTQAPYSYAADNPLNAADPSGLSWWNPTTWSPRVRSFVGTAATVAGLTLSAVALAPLAPAVAVTVGITGLALGVLGAYTSCSDGQFNSFDCRISLVSLALTAPVAFSVAEGAAVFSAVIGGVAAGVTLIHDATQSLYRDLTSPCTQ